MLIYINFKEVKPYRFTPRKKKKKVRKRAAMNDKSGPKATEYKKNVIYKFNNLIT